MAKVLSREVCLGRLMEYKASLKHPERTAYRCGRSWASDYTFQEWPNRESMAKSIRIQERSAKLMGFDTRWKAVIALSLGEGY